MQLQPTQAARADAVALAEPPRRASAPRDLPRPMGDPVVIVGGGPSGVRVAQEVTRRGLPAILFNSERWKPYNRLKLTPFLAGEVQIGVVYQPTLLPRGALFAQYTGHSIVAIDREAKTVENQFGRRWRYSKLVLCVGSRPHIPPIPGNDLAGVYCFRSFDDVERLVARAVRSRRTAVIGGGLLGLEAARGMARRKVDTVVVEHESHLMARQLDLAGGKLLGAQIVAMGLDVRAGCSVKTIAGEGRVEYLTLSTGEAIACDTVVLCTGIRSNTELAREAGIAIGRGIAVNDAMQTSDPDVYAVGECAEHDGHVYGLVAPGLEQAAVAAAHLAGESASYSGSVPTTKLKVVGTDVFSMGDVEQIDQRNDVRTVAWRSEDETQYRRLVLMGGRLIGALGVGDWPEVNQVQQAVRARARLWPWQMRRFEREGRAFTDRQPASVLLWPAAATVCNCTGVTRGQLGDAIGSGAATVEALSRETSACSVCGTCKPLLQELLGGKVQHEPVFGARSIAVASMVAVVLALAVILLPAWPFSMSVEAGIGIDRFWIDGFWKQVTGFTLLGLSAFAAFLSIRKRLRWTWLGGYRSWRVVHVVVGASLLAVLFAHTGLHLGSNLNQWLMLTFLAVLLAGSVTGVVTAREHALIARGADLRRRLFTWLHILAFWPVPLLLMFHVLTVYAY